MPGERYRREVAELYAAARQGVVRYLIVVGLDPDTAEEATQEAFLRLYIALRDGIAIQQPKSWVYRVAHNIAMNTARRNGAQTAFSEGMEATIASAEASAVLEHSMRSWRCF